MRARVGPILPPTPRTARSPSHWARVSRTRGVGSLRRSSRWSRSRMGAMRRKKEGRRKRKRERLRSGLGLGRGLRARVRVRLGFVLAGGAVVVAGAVALDKAHEHADDLLQALLAWAD